MRLTKKVEDKTVFHVCDKTCLACNGTSCGFTQAIVDRLAAYEDMGLSPEEIKLNIDGLDEYHKAEAAMEGEKA